MPTTGDKKKKARQATPEFRILGQADAEKFEESARAWTAANSQSPAAAKDTLVSLGILTRSGRLSKRYGS